MNPASALARLRPREGGRHDQRRHAGPARGALGGHADAQEARGRGAPEEDPTRSLGLDPALDPLLLPEHLTAPFPSYVSLLSALTSTG